MSGVAKVWLSLRSMVVVGDNDLVITDINRHVSYYFGWTKDDLVGKNIAFLVEGHPQELPDVPVMVLRGRHKKDYYFTVLASPMRDPQATIVGWVLTAVTLPPPFDYSFQPTMAAAISKKMTLDDVDVRARRVLIRVDFNVPIDEASGLVRDDNRIRQTLRTIRRVTEHGGKCILMSHLGRPGGKPNPKMSLKPVKFKLEELLGKPVSFADDCMKAGPVVNKMKNGDVVLLENLRFHKGEESKQLGLRQKMAEKLASYCDLFVSDAFGTAHREAASMTGVPRIIGAGIAGYLIEREVDAVRKLTQNPQSPVVAIVGGSKVSDKIALLGNMFNFANTVIIGGSMAFTFLEALGHNVAKSRVERVAKSKGLEVDLVTVAKQLMQQAKDKNVNLVLPLDHRCAADLKSDAKPQVSKGADVIEGCMALDIGPETVEKSVKILREARTVVWNGPVGVFENPLYAEGCEALARAIANNTECYSLAGGGDTAAAIRKFKEGFTHVSTGGGATLELLEGKPLPGLVCLTSRMWRGAKL